MCLWHLCLVHTHSPMLALFSVSKRECNSLPESVSPYPGADLFVQHSCPISVPATICAGTSEPSWIYLFPSNPVFDQSSSFIDIFFAISLEFLCSHH